MTIQYDNTNTQISAVGAPANIPIVFQTKGTGALDFSAGSTGINISNGNTVTAITRTTFSGTYTSFPSVALSAPQIAGGIQATASVASMIQSGTSPTINGGGTGYTNGDVLTVVGGTPSSVAATMTVTSVSGGVITGINYTNFAAYTALPANPFSVTGGTGSGATFSSTWYPLTFTITNAGSGYVEQPTVTFSGGGGSGAAAYATVGSGTVIRGLGSTGLQTIDFVGPNYITGSIPILRLRDVGTADSYVMLQSGSFSSPAIVAQGSANANLFLGSNGTGRISFTTNGTSGLEQFRVSSTGSAVNYVQVTGAATTANPIISSQGSDTNIGFVVTSKGTGAISFFTNNGSQRQLRLIHTANAVNFLDITGAATGGSPSISVAAASTDTNIDLALTPKGTGDMVVTTGQIYQNNLSMLGMSLIMA